MDLVFTGYLIYLLNCYLFNSGELRNAINKSMKVSIMGYDQSFQKCNFAYFCRKHPFIQSSIIKTGNTFGIYNNGYGQY